MLKITTELENGASQDTFLEIVSFSTSLDLSTDPGLMSRLINFSCSE
jgi:hypothetical protein